MMKEERRMKYSCDACGYVYDEATGEPDEGIVPGTTWDDLPGNFACPYCGAGKNEFSLEDE